MKKNIIMSALVFLFGYQSTACLGEAQIIAKISRIGFTSPTTCYIKLDIEDIKHYASNALCPLDLSEVVQSEISVPTIDQGQCSAVEDDMISGVVVKEKSGRLILE